MFAHYLNLACITEPCSSFPTQLTGDTGRESPRYHANGTVEYFPEGEYQSKLRMESGVQVDSTMKTPASETQNRFIDLMLVNGREIV